MCVLITSWDKLPAAQASLPALLDSINSLDIDDKNKQTLIANWNLINKTIPNLQDYVVTFDENLDVIYVQASCFQVLSFVEKLKSDVEYMKTSSIAEMCDKTCPNTFWDYSPSECSCHCKVSDCDAATQKIDYWNCQCAPSKDSCTLTQDQCAADSDKILDYTACLCKVKP